tara:strand:- start:998 stop:1471 length:474 start_codon:yes stop_codon:yes gene_type:complete
MKIRDNALTTPGKITGARTNQDKDVVGMRSERIARVLGTGKYLAIQTLVVIAWITVNAVAGANGLWDEYPFILLNLLFSIQAAYAAPLILLAQTRQEARDRALAERDREINDRILSDSGFMTRELAAIRLKLEDIATSADVEDLLKDLKDSSGEERQ